MLVREPVATAPANLPTVSPLERIGAELIGYIDEAIRTTLAEYATARRW